MTKKPAKKTQIPPPETRKEMFDKLVANCQSFVIEDGRRMYILARNEDKDGNPLHLVTFWDEQVQDGSIMYASDAAYQKWIHAAGFQELPMS